MLEVIRMITEFTMLRWIAFCLLCLMISFPLYAQDDTLTPYQIALQKIETARETNASELYLGQLTELPPEIGQLTNLRILIVSSNLLTTLPPEIGQLENLQWLELDSNHITSLPAEIGQLKNLILLSIDFNLLTTVPAEIGLLSNLQFLNLANNQLESLPAEIGQLHKLRNLYLYNNQLTTLPPEIGLLSRLCSLHLDTNHLSHLPATIGNLTSLQDEECFFEFTDNKWGQEPGLELNENPFISPPPEVVEQGTAAVLDYLRNQAWYHTQRLIVGAAGGVGLFVLLMLGFRWKQRGGRKIKAKRG
jgi:internalin A